MIKIVTWCLKKCSDTNSTDLHSVIYIRDLIASIERATEMNKCGEKQNESASRKSDRWRSGELKAIQCISDLHVKNSGNLLGRRIVCTTYTKIGRETENRRERDKILVTIYVCTFSIILYFRAI